ncbi:MAG TPA: zf-HC2 domain-containing protein [bacterium]|nr:zf-HC2 domain-containing protein [bacterium]
MMDSRGKERTADGGEPGKGRECAAWSHEDLIDFVDGTLTEQRSREAERHLAVCSTCRGYVESVRRTIAAFQHDPVPEQPDGYWSCFEQVVRQRSSGQGRSWRRRVAFGLVPGVAVLVVVAALAVHYLGGGRPTTSPGTASGQWSAVKGGGAGVDSVVAGSLAQLGDEALTSLDDYLGDDDDVVALVNDLPHSAKQSLVSRLSELMKLKG